MSLRNLSYELAHQHRLDPHQYAALAEAAGLHAEPAGALTWLIRTVTVVAGALLGLGSILWVAANWDSLGRIGQFVLLQSLVGAAALAGLVLRPGRAALLLLALLAQGGLLAYFGQTYQTGADPWQLFALWAALALPLGLAARSDVVWAPWSLVVTVGIALWLHAHQGRALTAEHASSLAYVAAWAACFTVAAGLSRWPPAQRHTGAGTWSFRTAITLACLMVGATGLSALFSHDVRPAYALALLVLVAAALLLVRAGIIDVLALSAIGLAVDGLLICGLGRWLLNLGSNDPIFSLLFLGLTAAGLVAATVWAILRLTRGHPA